MDPKGHLALVTSSVRVGSEDPEVPGWRIALVTWRCPAPWPKRQHHIQLLRKITEREISGCRFVSR